MRVEQIGAATLYLGDARECEALQSADAIITDPVWPNCPPGLLQGHNDPGGLLRDTLACLSPTRAAIVLRSDSDPRMLASVPPTWRFVCLQALAYAVPSYIGRVLGGTEIAYGFGEPIPVAPGRRLIPMWSPKAQPSDRPPNGHPCSRAQVHMDWLVSWWSLPGEIVADPFMGSGTMAVAALSQGRSFIGCEIEERYFDLTCRRIENSLRQGRMFGDAA
jgi:site-specific DNA-methyltransferase (adenine-specific)